jgi:uncharacterized alpha-E superfamily protein
MLLGRTANGLFWMYAYIERAENMARLLDAGLRMALTRTSNASEEWSSVVASAGTLSGFQARHDVYNAATVSDFLLRDADTRSSVISAIGSARTNARMVRTALTGEVWESINDAWMTLTGALAAPVPESELPRVLDLIKSAIAQIRGAFYGTMLHNEIFNFSQLGTFIERADSTSRILDVKYYVLLPAVSYVGGSIDNYQWESILRSVAAHRSYRWVYDAQYKPVQIADYLILDGRMPRSLHFCYRNIVSNLEHLAEDYGIRVACHQSAGRTLATLKGRQIEGIFEHGLHEFLSDFIKQNNRLGTEIAQAYNFD